jgi:3-hydroxyisobutyrate dehydrogenase-like beta-hydroxyacid dehydrogenase
MEIGFVGLGRMGTAMARNLAKAGHGVRAWNRSPVNLIEGITVVPGVADVFQAEVVFTMLSDDAAIREVLLKPAILRKGRSGLVHVVTSTISLALADEMGPHHKEAGIGYVSAPVFGRPDVAEAAQLSIVAAGAADAIGKVQPLLEIIGRRVWILGDDPKQANAAKIAGNMMIAMAIEAMAEGAALAQDAGLSPATFLELMLQTQFSGSRAYENYSAKMLNSNYEAGFRLQLGLKDLGLAAAAAEQSGLVLPMLRALRMQMNKAADAGMGHKDWSAIADYTLHGKS